MSYLAPAEPQSRPDSNFAASRRERSGRCICCVSGLLRWPLPHLFACLCAALWPPLSRTGDGEPCLLGGPFTLLSLAVGAWR